MHVRYPRVMTNWPVTTKKWWAYLQAPVAQRRYTAVGQAHQITWKLHIWSPCYWSFSKELRKGVGWWPFIVLCKCQIIALHWWLISHILFLSSRKYTLSTHPRTHDRVGLFKILKLDIMNHKIYFFFYLYI